MTLLDTADTNTRFDTASFDAIIKQDKENLSKIRELARQGNFDCQKFLSQMSLAFIQKNEYSSRSDQNMLVLARKNFEIFTKLAAEQGDVTAQFNLAQYYLKSVDMEQEYLNLDEVERLKLALYWYEKAEANGQPDLSSIIDALSAMQLDQLSE